MACTHQNWFFAPPAPGVCKDCGYVLPPKDDKPPPPHLRLVK